MIRQAVQGGVNQTQYIYIDQRTPLRPKMLKGIAYHCMLCCMITTILCASEGSADLTEQ